MCYIKVRHVLLFKKLKQIKMKKKIFTGGLIFCGIYGVYSILKNKKKSKKNLKNFCEPYKLKVA